MRDILSLSLSLSFPFYLAPLHLFIPFDCPSFCCCCCRFFRCPSLRSCWQTHLPSPSRSSDFFLVVVVVAVVVVVVVVVVAVVVVFDAHFSSILFFFFLPRFDAGGDENRPEKKEKLGKTR